MKPTRMNHLNWSRSAGIALTVTLITFCGQTLHAADWVGGTSTDWNTAANWSGGVVPNNQWASIWTGPSNFPVISADVTVAPSVVNIGSGGSSRLDHTAGSLAMANGGWEGGAMHVGGGGASGTYNLADVDGIESLGEFTGYATGSGSFASGAWGGINLGAGWWWDHSTAVMNINTSGTVNSNGQMYIAGKSGDVATANLDAGTVTIHGGWQNSMQIACIAGASTNSTGSLNISGGTVTLDHRLVIGSGSTTSTRTGAGTVEDPYVYSDFLYADGSTSGTVTMKGGTITCQTVYNTNGDAENWHAGVSMASAYDGSTGGTATFNLDGGTLSTVYVFSEASTGNDGNGDPYTSIAGTSTFNFNGGTLKGQAAPQGWLPLMYGLTRANVRNGGAVIDANGNDRHITQVLEHSDIEGDAEKDGGLTKKGLGQLTVSSAFTYTGDTKVDVGTLTVQSASFNDTSTITIADGAILNLNTGGATDTVGALVLGVTTMTAPGTYGAVGNANADFTSDRITGSGLIELGGAAAPYTTWANANGATTQTMDLDHDNDGVDNGIEYFMGQPGSTFTANPAAVGDSVTWPMGANYTGAYGTDYEVQYSTDLVVWTQAPIGSGDNTVTVTAGTSVVYNMPTGGKSFVRLVVKN